MINSSKGMVVPIMATKHLKFGISITKLQLRTCVSSFSNHSDNSSSLDLILNITYNLIIMPLFRSNYTGICSSIKAIDRSLSLQDTLRSMNIDLFNFKVSSELLKIIPSS
jgi:hypothetical protein